MDEKANQAVASLRAVADAHPEQYGLRLQLAGLLHALGRHSEALTEATAVLSRDPQNADALQLVQNAVAGLSAAPQEPTSPAAPPTTSSAETPAPTPPASSEARPSAEETVAQQDHHAEPDGDFDWDQAAAQMGDLVPPPFVQEQPTPSADELTESAPGRITLADVGGLEAVKRRLDESFLVPMRNAEIARAFGKSLRGGLLMYGPPGCGKTYLARAVAGELGAGFLAVGMTDVLSPHIGGSEKALHAVFEKARSQGPMVLFLDEVDALGLRRSATGNSAWMRSVVNQLLLELDSAEGNNSQLYVLAATNHPWDLDEALLRPGRLDRSVLVTPPDRPARVSILRHHLSERPLAGIDLDQLAARTEGFSGADLEHLATTAAEKAMMQSISSGQVLPITMVHLEQALSEVNSSTLPWLESARNVVKFANRHGRYNELAEYLASRGMK